MGAVRPAKTDSIDVPLIADCLCCKRFEPSVLKNRAAAILDQVFLENERLFSDKFCPAALLKVLMCNR